MISIYSIYVEEIIYFSHTKNVEILKKAGHLRVKAGTWDRTQKAGNAARKW